MKRIVFQHGGQDFRVDYLYIGDFIKKCPREKNNEKTNSNFMFYRNSKKQVIRDIKDYFNIKLGIEMIDVVSTSQRKKFILQSDSC